jgi:hypothetical protein
MILRAGLLAFAVTGAVMTLVVGGNPRRLSDEAALAQNGAFKASGLKNSLSGNATIQPSRKNRATVSAHATSTAADALSHKQRSPTSSRLIRGGPPLLPGVVSRRSGNARA